MKSSKNKITSFKPKKEPIKDKLLKKKRMAKDLQNTKMAINTLESGKMIKSRAQERNTYTWIIYTILDNGKIKN